MFDKVFNRDKKPALAGGFQTIPWDDPHFSRRILDVHLDNSTDAASRGIDRVNAECAFLNDIISDNLGRPAHVCDLTCGPGLYAVQLARLGHSLVGVDFSPASIEYAQSVAEESDLPVTFQFADIRKVQFSEGSFDVNLFLYGQPNAFDVNDLKSILKKVRQWTKPGGLIVLDLASFDEIKKNTGQNWFAHEKSIFSQEPHLWLEEKTWHKVKGIQTHCIYIIDSASGEVREYQQWHQAYQLQEATELLEQTGWRLQAVYGDLCGSEYDAGQSQWMVLVGKAV